MKIIKKFNDGTALVQRGSSQPEIIKMEEIKEQDLTKTVTIVELDGDGFVIDGTQICIKVNPNTKVHIKVDSPDEDQRQGVVHGDALLKFLESLKSMLETPTIMKPSK